MSSRHTTTAPQQAQIADVLAQYTTNPELELQQRAVEYASLLTLGELQVGVLERMPPPELKATVMGIVSENKPVGSTRGGKEGDLLGDDIASPTPQAVQNSQDLLAEIFGSSVPATSPQPASSISPQPQKSNIQDILGLFDASPNPASPAPAPISSASSLAFSIPAQPLAQTQAPAAQQQPSTAPRLTSYTAYEKNELKITLTPQTSAARPGIVNIMARFQVSGTNTATGLHFQAAVPKVCFALNAHDGISVMLIGFLGAVTTTADASHVEFGRAAWDDRNATAACDRSSRDESAATIARGVYACWSSDTRSDRFLGIPSRADRVYVMSGVSCGCRCVLPGLGMS
jgi:hypothetical protein